MLFRSVAAAAFFAVASRATAEHEMQVSNRELFGILAPRDQTGYTPTQTFCKMGSTCAEACGDGYQMCPSTDNSIHCYNPKAAQVCCPGGAGMSCDAGYYCAGNASGSQLCCKAGLTLEQCAAAKGVSGSLTSQTPVPTTTSTTSSSSSSTSSSSSISSSYSKNKTVTAKTSSSVSAQATLPTYTGSNSTYTPKTSSTSAQTSSTQVGTSGAIATSPMGGATLALAGAVLAFALL